METLRRIALLLLIIGGINWGLIALFQFDLVATIFGGQDAALSRIVYGLVGLSALLCIPALFDMDEAGTSTRRANYGVEFGEEDEFDTRYDQDRK
jgi:uncharacterized membrane protein YuzA (DUF378 family)